MIKRIVRAVAFALAALLVASPAYAHDAVAGEELSGTQEILVISMILLIAGLIICFYAWRGGQFTNIEEPKYTMLNSESAADYACIEDPEDEESDFVPAPAPALPAKAAVGGAQLMASAAEAHQP